MGEGGSWEALASGVYSFPFAKLWVSEGRQKEEHDRKLASGEGLKEKGLCGLDLPRPPLGKFALQS